MIKKKNQAVLEWLREYGWVFLASLIVIGVLWYFGVFNPDRYSSHLYNYTCLAESLCESAGLNYSSYGNYLNGITIYCRRYISQSIYWTITLQSDKNDWQELEIKFFGCLNETAR